MYSESWVSGHVFESELNTIESQVFEPEYFVKAGIRITIHE